MGDEMLRQEMQAKDISRAESLSGASRGCSNRAGKSEQVMICPFCPDWFESHDTQNVNKS